MTDETQPASARGHERYVEQWVRRLSRMADLVEGEVSKPLARTRAAFEGQAAAAEPAAPEPAPASPVGLRAEMEAVLDKLEKSAKAAAAHIEAMRH